jgi:hypothetical protein
MLKSWSQKSRDTVPLSSLLHMSLLIGLPEDDPAEGRPEGE